MGELRVRDLAETMVWRERTSVMGVGALHFLDRTSVSTPLLASPTFLRPKQERPEAGQSFNATQGRTTIISSLHSASSRIPGGFPLRREATLIHLPFDCRYVRNFHAPILFTNLGAGT